MSSEGKPAIKSRTYQGLGAIQTVVLGVVVGIVAKKLGVTDAGDIAILKDASGDLVPLVLAVIAQVGIIVAAIGRRNASQPITGVIRAPAASAADPAAPANEDPPY